MSEPATIPKIIWSLWLQGWEHAPRVAAASAHTWRSQNPGWRVHQLDRSDLPSLLSPDVLSQLASNENPAAQSDQIRIALLSRYGGVWADATTLCTAPLDSWLPVMGQSGFFAFDRPAPDRMLASWFLAAERGNYIVERWHEATTQYWAHRSKKLEDYFWFHHLFGKIHAEDENFRRAWDDVPKLSAIHDGHFSPHDERLLEVVETNNVSVIDVPPSTVLKLTHKFNDDAPSNRLIDKLCDWAEGLSTSEQISKRLLVAWYGSFAGHGTVGDALALQTLLTHLVGRGHRVSHATADDLTIPGSDRVQWDVALPEDFDAILFVCGPILRFHAQTQALFQRFSNAPLAGVAVSMMPPDHPNHLNPFQIVLAREGGDERHGDLAIVAPHKTRQQQSHRQYIGLALRGHQTEYGEDRCRWRETELLARELATSASSAIGSEVIEIENHLTRSGMNAEQIEDQYADCALIITSRFHGAIAAMRQGTPFIALDQIAGGAKVMSLLTPLGWPHVYQIDQANAEELRRTVLNLVRSRHHPALTDARNKAVKAANATLASLDDWLDKLSVQ